MLKNVYLLKWYMKDINSLKDFNEILKATNNLIYHHTKTKKIKKTKKLFVVKNRNLENDFQCIINNTNYVINNLKTKNNWINSYKRIVKKRKKVYNDFLKKL